MGFCITSKKSLISLRGGYLGFMHLRKEIANILDKEFGEHYKTLGLGTDYDKFNKIANEIIERKQLNESILDFLFQPDSAGSLSPKQCKELYELIKDKNSEIIFTYAAYSDGKDWQHFKELLKECVDKKRKLIWG